MLKDIVERSARPSHRLYIRFEDGVAGEIDVAAISNFVGVFAALRDEASFAQVALNPELVAIQWQTGADLDPDFQYATRSRIDVKVSA
ncbi:MAG: DUF2442 domain-containing protein [Burkholderiales bacterium]|jgi:hypothetical protein